MTPRSSSHKWWNPLLAKLAAARDIYEGLFFVPYRSSIYRQYLRERDIFFVLGLSDMLGVPNPVTFYTLELYPELLQDFHEWHRRMGLEEPPEGGFRCC